MRLELRFSNRPLESLSCQAVVILAFSDPDLPKGVLCELYAQMTGAWPHLEKTGFWTGACGETLLVPSQGMIRADKILLKGLGESAAFDALSLTDRVGEVSAALDSIDVREFGIHIPIIAGSEERYSLNLELAARHLVEPFLENHQNRPDFMLKVIFSVGTYPSAMLTPGIKRLREEFASIKDLYIGTEQEMDEVVMGERDRDRSREGV